MDGLASLRKPRARETAKTLLHTSGAQRNTYCRRPLTSFPLAFLTAVLLGLAIRDRKLQNDRCGQMTVPQDCFQISNRREMSNMSRLWRPMRHDVVVRIYGCWQIFPGEILALYSGLR
jgi:hypothetical protein